MGEQIEGYYDPHATDLTVVEEKGGERVTLPGSGGRWATATVGGETCKVQGRFTTTPFSSIVPGQGKPSVQEQAQWTEGTLARYPCCSRVQPCGLIYCLFCNAKLLLNWTQVTEAQDGGPEGDMDEEVKARAAIRSARAVIHGSAGGRSTGGVFVRQLRQSLAYALKWRGKSLQVVQELAAQGKCPEIAWAKAVTPWYPSAVTQWHPDVMSAWHERAIQEGKEITDEEMNFVYVTAASTRIMIEDMGYTKFPNVSEDSDEHARLLTELRERLANHLVASIPFATMAKRRAVVARDDPELQHVVAKVFGLRQSTGSGGRLAAVADGEPETGVAAPAAASSAPATIAEAITERIAPKAKAKKSKAKAETTADLTPGKKSRPPPKAKTPSQSSWSSPQWATGQWPGWSSWQPSSSSSSWQPRPW